MCRTRLYARAAPRDGSIEALHVCPSFAYPETLPAMPIAVNPFIEEQRVAPTWGTFIDDFSYAPEALEMMDKNLVSAFTHKYQDLRGQNDVFDEYANLMNQSTMRAEDQCTEQWYYDIFQHFRLQFGRTRHVVELGCFFGGSSRWLYVASRLFNFTLDVVDARSTNLAATRARLLAVFGVIGPGVRFFHGDLCSYIEKVAQRERRAATTIHHDGPHSFHECVQYFAALYYIRDTLHHLIIQDTNLRSAHVDYYSFVDLAACAVFGKDHPFQPIGKSLVADAPLYQHKIYFDRTEPEGKIIPMRDIGFRYPHPSTTADAYFEQLLSR